MLRRTKLGLLHSLVVQYDGLRLSASMYDAGHRGEAIRIANAMFVLLGPDMRNHKSIFSQLGKTESLTIPSTADPRGPHGSALIAIEAIPYTDEITGDGSWVVEAVPNGHETLGSGRVLSVVDWWSEGILRGVGSTGTLTRLQVVRVMRDQDGGAHLDDSIRDETYLAVLLKGAGFQYKPRADSEEAFPVDGTLSASIRQMAHEVLHVIRGSAISHHLSEGGEKRTAPHPIL